VPYFLLGCKGVLKNQLRYEYFWELNMGKITTKRVCNTFSWLLLKRQEPALGFFNLYSHYLEVGANLKKPDFLRELLET